VTELVPGQRIELGQPVVELRFEGPAWRADIGRGARSFIYRIRCEA
jgi:hypothetical protein